MAKVSGPLMSMTASGSLAKTLCFSVWKGKAYVRNHVIPSNPQSDGQQTARSGLGAAGKMNHFVAPASTVGAYLVAHAPQGQSGVSFYAGHQIADFAQSKTDYEDSDNTTVKGYFDTAAASLGLTDITIPGDTPVTVPAGLILWNGYQAAFELSSTLAPTAAVDATSSNITTFTGHLSS